MEASSDADVDQPYQSTDIHFNILEETMVQLIISIKDATNVEET